jgi:CRISPR-associated protein Cas5d
LREVDYIIYADVELKPGIDEHPNKFREQFRRRVAKGQCFHRPSLGCREFAADFEPVEEGVAPIDWTEDLGLMLWDLEYAKKPPFWPKFFDAQVRSGVLHVPAEPLGGSR